MSSFKFTHIGLLFFIGSMICNSGLARDFVELVQFCEKCHGQDGVSTTADVPIIAGFSYEGFLNTIEVFRENERIAIEFHRPGEPETVMNEVAQSLSDDEAEQLASYFSKRQFVPAIQTADTERARRGAILHKKSCERCHTDNGREPVEDAAILAGQWSPYLKRQFDNILQKKRLVPKSMYRKIKRLKSKDIDALLNFYALEGQRN